MYESPPSEQCPNNLKQLMLALHNYESAGKPVPAPSAGDAADVAEQAFPTGCIGPGTYPEERLSWMVAILPYLEQDQLYNGFDLEKGYAGNLRQPESGSRRSSARPGRSRATR